MIKQYLCGSITLVAMLSACGPTRLPQSPPSGPEPSQSSSGVAKDGEAKTHTIPHRESAPPMLKLTAASQGEVARVKLISESDLKSTLLGPRGVKRWEPSGAAFSPKGLWVVNDRGGWLARYALPLRAGAQRPLEAHQLKPALDHRVKWEGLAWERDAQGQTTALLLLEAISRSVWRCQAPERGCPELTQEPLADVNRRLNGLVPSSFKYIMFEAVAYHRDLQVGVRGYQDQARGLMPWSMIFTSQELPKLDAREGITLAQEKYGISGAEYDRARHGYWLTWSYENEAGNKRDAVRGLLTFLPDAAPQSLQLCARFNLKPEGVTATTDGGLYIVFDEDLDRKAGCVGQATGSSKETGVSAESGAQDSVEEEVCAPHEERFRLRDTEDYAAHLSSAQLQHACALGQQ